MKRGDVAMLEWLEGCVGGRLTEVEGAGSGRGEVVMCALKQGSLSSLEWLCEHGARMPSRIDGTTFAHLVEAGGGHVEVIRWLHSKALYGPPDDPSLLLRAIQKSQESVVEELLAQGSRYALNGPQCMAAVLHQGTPAMLQALLAHPSSLLIHRPGRKLFMPKLREGVRVRNSRPRCFTSGGRHCMLRYEIVASSS